MCSLKCPRLSIDRYPRSTSRSIQYRHPDRCPEVTRSTLDQQSVDSQPSVDRLICIDRKLVDCRARSRWTVYRVSSEVSINCRSSIDREYRSTLDRGFRYRGLYSNECLMEKRLFNLTGDEGKITKSKSKQANRVNLK